MSVSLKSRIPEITAALPVEVGAAIHSGTEQIAQAAADRAPVESGDLRNSIEATSGDAGYGIYAIWYWFFPEFGTSHSGAEPYMIPAVEAGKDNLAEEVRGVLGKL